MVVETATLLINSVDMYGTNQTSMLNTIISLVQINIKVIFLITDGTNIFSFYITSGTSGESYYTFEGQLISNYSFSGPAPYTTSFSIMGPTGPTGPQGLTTYTPANSAHWESPVPTDFASAIDRLVAYIYSTNTNIPIP